jgi:geranylgeranyl diphosphate synthase type I
MKNQSIFESELLKVSELVSQTISTDNWTSDILPDFLMKAVRDYPLRKGKRLRPALLLWTCGLFGGDPESAKFAAAAVEVFHNWTLVHDDIIDKDEKRKGLPSMHFALAKFAKTAGISREEAGHFGLSQAILVGDIQHSWSFNLLWKSRNCGISTETLLVLSERLNNLGGKILVCGESLDVETSFRNWDEISEGKVLKIAEMKTGALLEFCVVCGAMIALDGKLPAEKPHPDIAEIAKFAKLLGTAFQLKDDWLGIFGEKNLIGKPLFSDLAAKKPNFILLRTLRSAKKKDLVFLKSLFGKKEYSGDEIKRTRDIIRNCGAERENIDKIENIKDEAVRILSRLPESKFRVLLEELVQYLLERNY